MAGERKEACNVTLNFGSGTSSEDVEGGRNGFE